MLALVDIKDRLVSIATAVNNLIRECIVAEPRFTYVRRLTKQSGPEPEAFGKIYCDQRSGKEYLVDDLYVSGATGPDFYAVFSIREIKSRPTDQTHFDEATFKKVVSLKRADIDVQEDMVAFFAEKSKKLGREFEDRRPSGTKDLGRNRGTCLACNVA